MNSLNFKPLIPYVMGVLVAGIIFVFPDAKPIACGLGFAAAASVGG